MTETTTQPDPQVVARIVVPAGMSVEWDLPIHRLLRSGAASMESRRNADGSETVTIRRVEPAARTVADIPAGQGAASLFIAPGDVLGYAIGNAALWIQTEDGPLFIRWAASPGDSPADRALWALIEAHVPNHRRHQGDPMTAPAPTRPGLTAAHLPFLARLLAVAGQAGVTVTYCCFNMDDWSVMTSPELDDAAGAAFLAALDIGEVGEPEQKTSRIIRAGSRFDGGVCLYVRPIPTDDTTEESK